MKESIGVGKGTVTLEDFNQADLILLGQNPGTNHPRMLSSLQAARERGAKIVAINPLRERGLVEFLHPQRIGSMLTNKASAIASHYYQPLIGGDLALITGLIKAVCQTEELNPGEVFDHAFIEEHCQGIDAVVAKVAMDEWPTIESESGLSRSEIEELATLFIQADKNDRLLGHGLNPASPRGANPATAHQSHADARYGRQAGGGAMSRPRALKCPRRSHHGHLRKTSAAFLDALDKRFGITSPRQHGHDVVAAIEAMQAGAAEVFFAMGGNFAQATPDSAYTAKALRQCKLTVQVSTKLNRSHLIHGKEALILPCLGAAKSTNKAAARSR